jgi:hypothetical protein
MIALLGDRSIVASLLFAPNQNRCTAIVRERIVCARISRGLRARVAWRCDYPTQAEMKFTRRRDGDFRALSL